MKGATNFFYVEREGSGSKTAETRRTQRGKDARPCGNSRFSATPLQLRQHFRITHIHPPALDFQSGQFVIGRQQAVDGVCQFVFAARRFSELRGELEEDWLN